MTQPKHPAPIISSFTGAHAFLSNFFFSPITMPQWHPAAGEVAETVEHAFQAAKTANSDEAMRILRCSEPVQAKRAGRRVSLRAGWNEGRDVIMESLLKLKFAPGSDLAEMLVNTFDAELVEGNHWGDRYWGVCRGEGENRLGILLMKVRFGLIKEALR